MPTVSLNQQVRNQVGVKIYTNTAVVPEGLSQAIVTLDIPQADILAVDTDCGAGIEVAPPGTTDAQWASVARMVCAITLKYHPQNSPTMPYCEVPGDFFTRTVGWLVRGYIFTNTAGKRIGASLTFS